MKKIILLLLVLLPLVVPCSAGIIYGYWPENGVSPAEYQPPWSNLTHVAFASWMLYPDGSPDFRQIKIDMFEEIRDEAHDNNVKIIISTACDSQEMMDSILAYHQDDFVNNMSKCLEKYNADGIDLDWEEPYEQNSLTGEDNKVLMESLLKKLDCKLRPKYFVGIDSYTWPLYVYQNPELNQYIDAYFIMDYDMGLSSGRTMPNAPMYSKDRLDIPETVEAARSFGYTSDKIVLGMPFYGYDYTTTSNKAGARSLSVKMKNMKIAVPEAKRYGRIWDNTSQTPWYWYKSRGYYHQVWYDDPQSIKIKCDYAGNQKLAGIGFWALGKEDKSVWNFIH